MTTPSRVAARFEQRAVSIRSINAASVLRSGSGWALPLALVALVLLLPSLAHAADVSAAAPAATGSDTGEFARFAERSVFLAIAASFGIGVISSLTPCVFPMVPITVSIFGATQAKSRLAGAALSGAFVLGIAVLFTTLGIVSALSGTLMGAALAKPVVVIGIALLFVVLASSMFGAFEMALPQSLQARLSGVGGAGYAGAFVLGLVMGLVAMPCTGPFITGMVIWIATTKSVFLGAIAMFSFALGLGLLFFVAGAFAVNLPKAGAWMLGIKWVSGVGLATMAAYFLINRFPELKKIAVPGTTYGAIAAVILAIGLVLGAIHIAAERRRSPIAHLSKPMKLASILPALGGAAMLLAWTSLPKTDSSNVAQISWNTNEGEALARAQAEKKPVLIDFGAAWCAACRELEEHTFPDLRVRSEGQRYVAVRVDATDEDDPSVQSLQSKYNVRGLPTVIVLDSEGKEAARFNEFVPPDRFAAVIRTIN